MFDLHLLVDPPSQQQHFSLEYIFPSFIRNSLSVKLETDNIITTIKIEMKKRFIVKMILFTIF